MIILYFREGKRGFLIGRMEGMALIYARRSPCYCFSIMAKLQSRMNRLFLRGLARGKATSTCEVQRQGCALREFSA